MAALEITIATQSASPHPSPPRRSPLRSFKACKIRCGRSYCIGAFVSSGCPKADPGLLKMSGVSRRWRAFIRGHSILWTTLPSPLAAPRMLELFVARSKIMPLKIASSIMTKNASKLSRYYALVSPIFNRLQVCVLAFSQNFEAEDIAALLCCATRLSWGFLSSIAAETWSTRARQSSKV
ncbi:hypothetical protein BOTBODRAFT_338041 [Botryobasidium botryosum FD-172 SS1]|uniref:Uncharacterized protein n=1 Tax=Botryobasidium botryosum (strain FD-172 SS1) TaxID=930990 RepID=A0A067MFS5_BOTB1|nr:hypothetical protein BOTBODRAFT_338041 [Botryobasidium botryosum FD-172 SS1]